MMNMMGMRPPMPGYPGVPPMPMGPMPGMPYPPNVPGPMPQPHPEPMPAQQPLPTDKEQLGERLYPMVERIDANNAAKITGMLLEMEIDQIHNIIRDPTQLDKWIQEAKKVLNTTPSQ